MTIKPLTGQVLVQILPAEKRSAGGIELPEHTASPEERQQDARNPAMPPPLHAIVREIGPWPKLANGMLMMPEFGLNARVIIGHYSGVELHRNINKRYRMVRTDQVLAVLT